MERHDLHLLTPEDIDWPGELQQLGASAPIALWLTGDPSRLSAPLPGLTIVGARAATAYGSQVATQLASELASQGRVILSGGAYGIDGAAHRSHRVLSRFDGGRARQRPRPGLPCRPRTALRTHRAKRRTARERTPARLRPHPVALPVEGHRARDWAMPEARDVEPRRQIRFQSATLLG